MGMGTRLHLILMIIVGILFLTTGVSAIPQEDYKSFNSSQAAMEIGLPVKITLHEIPKIPQTLDLKNQEITLINGTGNLSKLVEVNNTAGGYAFVQLEIEGTDTTHWSYQVQSNNATNDCFALATVQVENADKILLQGHAISPNLDVAYGGVGLSDDQWEKSGKYSGTVTVGSETSKVDTVAIVTGDDEKGSIEHICRSYHLVNNTDSRPSMQEVPGLEWNPTIGIQNVSAENLHFDKISGDFASLDHGGIKSYYGYAICDADIAFSYHQMTGGYGKTCTINTYAIQWPLENTNMPGNYSAEGIQADDVISLDHMGQAIIIGNNFGTYGATKCSAGSINYEMSPTKNLLDPLYFSGYVTGSATASTPLQGTNKSSIPATFDGWITGIFNDNVGTLYENYQLSGATVNRIIDGGAFNQESLETGVTSNITSGKDTKETSTSRINGVSKLVIDQNTGNTTTLDGRWMVDSPTGSPVTRYEGAVMPGTTAYSSSQTLSGSKYIKDAAYYRSGTVDVE